MCVCVCVSGCVLLLTHTHIVGAPPWSNNSVLDHKSLPSCLNLSVDIFEMFHL